jgi:hypothetical protein
MPVTGPGMFSKRKAAFHPLTGWRQRPLHNLLIPDGTAVGMKDKVHQISALGKGSATAAAASASTSRHTITLFFLICRVIRVRLDL